MERLAAPVSDPKVGIAAFEGAVEALAATEPLVPDLIRIRDTRTYWPLERSRYTEQQERDSKLFYQKEFEVLSVLTHYYDRLLRKDAKNLFLGILQIYALPPKTRKNVEACAKFYSRSRVNRPKRDKLFEDYLELLALLRAQVRVAKEAIQVGVPHAESGTEGEEGTRIRAGSFTIVNMSGFDPDVVKAASETMIAAEALFKKKGLGKVCYGDANISKAVASANTLAFYQLKSDEMFLFPAHKKSKDFLSTVCHELGHRLQFKFVGANNPEISALYRTLARKKGSEKDPEPGDTLVEHGKTYIVETTRWGARQKEVILRLESKPDAKFVVSVEKFVTMRGIPDGFVSAYAAKNEVENFAEMIAHYVTDRLSPGLVALLEPILK